MSNIEVVWNGAVYDSLWKFDQQVGSDPATCMKDTCVSRFWCTNSGANGYNGFSEGGASVPVYYSWLNNPNVTGKAILHVNGQEGDATVMDLSNPYGHGSILVVGNTLFFYTYVAGRHRYGLPRLSSLVFDEYDDSKDPADLVHWGIKAYNVLQTQVDFAWSSEYSPIYASSSSSITVSVQDFYTESSWSVDSVLGVSGAQAEPTVMVLSYHNVTPSHHSASREVISVPQFSCRTYANGTRLCARVGDGRSAWDYCEEPVLGMYFVPIRQTFSLPDSLWLLSDGGFTPLVGSGLSPLISFHEEILYGLVLADESTCATGKQIHLVAFGFQGGELRQQKDLRPAGCLELATVPQSNRFEPSYAVTTLKWVGPWDTDGGAPIFVAHDLATGFYYGPDIVARGCQIGRFQSEGECLTCQLGRRCDGFNSIPCENGTYQNETGKAKCLACPRNTYSGQGAVQCIPCAPGFHQDKEGQPSCSVCPAGYYCRGDADPVSCSLSLGRGAALCEPCGTKSAWYEGKCTACSELPQGYTCKTRRGISHVKPPYHFRITPFFIVLVVFLSLITIGVAVIGGFSIRRKRSSRRAYESI